MKIIICENFLQELKITAKKYNPGTAQDVYIGNKTVTKKINSEYEEEFLPIYTKISKLMAENPDIFAKTKLVNGGWVVQEKLNTDSFIADCEKLKHFTYVNCNCPTDYITDILNEYYFKKNKRYKECLSCIFQRLKKKWPQMLFFLKAMIKIYLKSYFLYSKTYSIHQGKDPDLHINNFAYDKNNNIKIIDFINFYDDSNKKNLKK